MDKVIIKISDEYTKTPGVREEIEGDFPGEEFLAKILLPKFEQAVREKKILYVDFDDTAGYPTSFLEAAFGGIARHYGDAKFVLKNIEFKSDDDPFLISDVKEYINEANNK